VLGLWLGKDTVSRTWRKVKRDWDAWLSEVKNVSRANDPQTGERSVGHKREAPAP